jgi:hypothetical protein
VGFFGKKEEDHGAQAEIYAGYGAGSATSEGNFGIFSSSSSLNLVQGDYERFFMQFNGGAFSKVVDAGIAVRTSYVVFYRFFDSQGNPAGGRLDRTFLEPVVFTRVGYKVIKFEMQLGLSLAVSGTASANFRQEPLIYNFGLRLMFNQKYD